MGIESPIQIIMIFRLKVVLQDMDLNYYYLMLIGVQGQITTLTAWYSKGGAPLSTQEIRLTGMIPYAGGAEWGLPLKK